MPMIDLYAALASARETVASIERAIEASKRPLEVEDVPYRNAGANGNYDTNNTEREVYDF